MKSQRRRNISARDKAPKNDLEKLNSPVKQYRTIFNSNLTRRSILTVFMVGGFLSSLKLTKIWLFMLVYSIKTLAYMEITRTLKFPSKMRFIPSSWLPWYFMIVADIRVIGSNLMRIYSDVFPIYVTKNHMFACFVLYVLGLMTFVIHLDLRVIKTQFAQFALSHVAIFFSTINANVFITNICHGKLWFFFPALLIVTNDIFAYIVGKSFGKTPLLKLSPKKTREGFLGGLLATILMGIALAHIKTRFGLFEDKYDYLILQSRIFQIGAISVPIKYIYLHAISFVLFAGLIAPFGGFFASGFKRAFKLKDFGESIPGHGGFVDRMDCQFLMGMFTYVYYKTFIRPKVYSVEKIYEIICDNMDRQEIERLIDMLRNCLAG